MKGMKNNKIHLLTGLLLYIIFCDMEIEIIPLALRKINLRKIPIEWVKETIITPDQIVAGYGDRKVWQRIYKVTDKDMLLRVICEKEKGKQVVITAYLTTQIKKYWEEK